MHLSFHKANFPLGSTPAARWARAASVNPLRITYGIVRTWVTGMKAHGRPLADADARVR